MLAWIHSCRFVYIIDFIEANIDIVFFFFRYTKQGPTFVLLLYHSSLIRANESDDHESFNFC